jgi:hypothetical protein
VRTFGLTIRQKAAPTLDFHLQTVKPAKKEADFRLVM